MKISYNIEMDVNELNATINGVKDLLNFIVTQQKQDGIERRISDLESKIRRKELDEWWNGDKTKQPKDSCE